MTETSPASCLRISIDTPSSTPEQIRFARKLARGVAAINSVLELERWTSSLLGRVWEGRHRVDRACGVDPMLVRGAPILKSFAEVGGRGARTVLTAVARLDRGALGALAREMAASLADAPIPEWVELVGTATIVKAFATGAPGDGEALLLEVEQLGDMPHMVAVFIAEYCGGIAKQLALMRLIDPTDRFTAPSEAYNFKPVDHVLACRRVELALIRSEHADPALLGTIFADHRAIAIARVNPLTAISSPEWP
jgi:hypothetical protein